MEGRPKFSYETAEGIISPWWVVWFFEGTGRAAKRAPQRVEAPSGLKAMLVVKTLIAESRKKSERPF
jgi:hypothetical protein